jgi:hypothetical protein
MYNRREEVIVPSFVTKIYHHTHRKEVILLPIEKRFTSKLSYIPLIKSIYRTELSISYCSVNSITGQQIQTD